MFCSGCGNQIDETAVFCAKCGKRVCISEIPMAEEKVRVVLDPSEVAPQKEIADSGSSLSGHGRTIGLILMILSFVVDFVALFLIGFEAFIPVTIIAGALFMVGFLIRMFCL